VGTSSSTKYKAIILVCILLGCSRAKEHVVIFDAMPGESVTITTKTKTVIMDTPLSTADIELSGSVKLNTSTLEALQMRYAPTLSTTPEASAIFTLYFGTGKIVLSNEGHITLDAILAEIQRRGIVEVQITGHTDQAGDDVANDKLSLSRAETVRLLLQQGGVTASFVRVTGRGEREPLIDTPGKAQEKNRRVEVLVR